MSQLRQRMEAPLAASVLVDRPDLVPDARGAYVWMLDGSAIYVGIANKLQRRVQDHLNGDPSRANLAVRIAAQSLECSLNRVKRHSNFDRAFADAKLRLRSGSVAHLEIENPMTLYLFEPFCAMELDTCIYNFFDTLQILSPKPQ